MDSDVNEKAELERIQHAVKENKRRQRKLLLHTQAEARRGSVVDLTGQANGSNESTKDVEMLEKQYRRSRLRYV